MAVLYLTFALVFGVFLGIVIGLSKRKPDLSRGERNSLVRHRVFVAQIHTLAVTNSDVEPFARTVLDEVNTFITSENRTIK